MSMTKPDFDTVFIAAAAISSGPHAFRVGGALNNERFKRVFKELLDAHQDCQNIFMVSGD